MSDQNQAAFGFALAGFMLSMQSLAARVRTGEMKADDARDIVLRAATMPTDAFPGGPGVVEFAHAMLGTAMKAIDEAAADRAGKPPPLLQH
jgi:hypothetical protein